MAGRDPRSRARVIDDYVSFIDLAPTFLEVAGAGPRRRAGMQPITGTEPARRSSGPEAGRPSIRDATTSCSARSDTTSGGPTTSGYPIRGIVTDGWLYLHNFEPDRWPAGNPETGYLNCDGSPTKTAILELRREAARPASGS